MRRPTWPPLDDSDLPQLPPRLVGVVLILACLVYLGLFTAGAAALWSWVGR